MTGDLQTHERWLSGEFAARLGVVLEAMTGTKPRVECPSVTSAAPSGAAGELVLEQKLSGIAGGSLWICATRVNWQLISSAILLAAGIEDAEVETSRSTFLETIGQATGGLCQSLSVRLRCEVTPEQPVELAIAPPNAKWVDFEVFLNGGVASLKLGLSEELLDGISARNTAVMEASPVSAASDAPADESRTLDLLFDVELPVSVSFGRAQLPLKDVIKLTTGSIVELNRAISEPVEIIVNNCVIARGDVVVIEGNFGVRIQHVISRKERLRTLT